MCARTGYASAAATYSLCVLHSQEREPWHVKTYTVKPLQRPLMSSNIPFKVSMHPSFQLCWRCISVILIFHGIRVRKLHFLMLSPFCMITNLQWGCTIWPELNGSYTNSIKVKLTSKSFEFPPLYSLVDLRPTAFLKGKEKDSSVSADLPQLHKGVNVGKISPKSFFKMWTVSNWLSQCEKRKTSNEFHHQRG